MKIKKGDLVKIDMTFGENTEIVSDYGIVLSTYQEMSWAYGDDEIKKYQKIKRCTVYWINNNDKLLPDISIRYTSGDTGFMTIEDEENLTLVKSAEE